jgi:DNA-binding NtrC family response regulator
MKAILVVDDHKLLARVNCEILKMEGYHAEYVHSPSDAMAMFDRGKFDMLVTDYRMEGMNGLELAKSIRKKAPGLPVIIVSGHSPVEHSDEVDAWIEKKAIFPYLLDKVRMLLSERDSPAAPERA